MANKLATTSLLAAVLLALAAPSLAGDPDMLQDICVADYKSLQGPLRLNGFPCKRPENVTADDFFSNALASPGSTCNALGSAVTPADVRTLPGLNTLGVSVSRIDYAPWGVNPPHVHPRATEVIFVLQGSLDVGFVAATATGGSRRPPVRARRRRRRGLRLPPGPRPLPEEQRWQPRRRPLRLRQPAARHAARRRGPLRRLAAGAHRRARQELPGRRRTRGGHQVQLPAQVALPLPCSCMQAPAPRVRTCTYVRSMCVTSVMV